MIDISQKGNLRLFVLCFLSKHSGFFWGGAEGSHPADSCPPYPKSNVSTSGSWAGWAFGLIQGLPDRRQEMSAGRPLSFSAFAGLSFLSGWGPPWRHGADKGSSCCLPKTAVGQKACQGAGGLALSPAPLPDAIWLQPAGQKRPFVLRCAGRFPPPLPWSCQPLRPFPIIFTRVGLPIDPLLADGGDNPEQSKAEKPLAGRQGRPAGIPGRVWSSGRELIPGRTELTARSTGSEYGGPARLGPNWKDFASGPNFTAKKHISARGLCSLMLWLLPWRGLLHSSVLPISGPLRFRRRPPLPTLDSMQSRASPIREGSSSVPRAPQPRLGARL